MQHGAASAAWRPVRIRFVSTIGVDFVRRDVGYLGSVLRLQIWDTAGPERYPAYREYVSTWE